MSLKLRFYSRRTLRSSGDARGQRAPTTRWGPFALVGGVVAVNIALMEFTFFDQHTVLLSTVDTRTESKVLESTVLWGTVGSSNPLSSTHLAP